MQARTITMPWHGPGRLASGALFLFYLSFFFRQVQTPSAKPATILLFEPTHILRDIAPPNQRRLRTKLDPEKVVQPGGNNLKNTHTLHLRQDVNLVE